MIQWSVSPEILSLGPITLRWYGLLFASGFLLGHAVASRYFKNEEVPLQYLDQLLLYVMIGTVVGARLGHCLFYEPEIYLRHPLRIFAVWEGGLASHGAAVGNLIAIYLFFKRTKKRFHLLWVLDRVSAPIALAGSLIRLGNLFNSEIIGRPTDLPWSFVFTRVDHVPRHPTQIYESLTYFTLFLILNRLYWVEKIRKSEGMIFGVFLIGVFGARIVLEFLKENQVDFESSMLLNMGQLLSIPLVIGGVVLIARARRTGDPRKPAA